jgi:hypothetical protein
VTAALTRKAHIHTRSSGETAKMTSGVMKKAVGAVSFSGDETPCDDVFTLAYLTISWHD